MIIRKGGEHTRDERAQLLRNRLTFPDRGVDEIKQVCVLVDGEAGDNVSRSGRRRPVQGTYRLAALAVSMTLPPPTLGVIQALRNTVRGRMSRNIRQEMTEVMFTSP